MALYKIQGNELSYIEEKPFKTEKEIQRLTEKNLKLIFGLEFVRSEFVIKNFRLDTLAFDTRSQAFVIIEYKRDKNFSVIDQGYSYLSLMLNYKAEFILAFNEKFSKTLNKQDIDWSQSKVIFIAPSFTNFQKEAINFKDLPIELWVVKRYKNDIVFYEQIKLMGAKEKTVLSNKIVESVSKEIRVYTEEDLLVNVKEEIKELYERFKTAILNLGDLEIKANKYYISFLSGRNIVDIQPQTKSLKIWINLSQGELNDPYNIARDVSKIGHHGNGDYEIKVDNDDNLEYILSLIKQAIKKSQNN